ncbi:hypothetical protein NDU88_006452 [Pleurodeles waltl]|uniref:Uncharacterized protein n=1 Tax=Pleurodeles waltl TaxID=8319 RepID=A0AAV7QKS7_PLEWA|nr:hypothetical protein NDU88_006452 [Pleurodeles waltl]
MSLTQLEEHDIDLGEVRWVMVLAFVRCLGDLCVPSYVGPPNTKVIHAELIVAMGASNERSLTQSFSFLRSGEIKSWETSLRRGGKGVPATRAPEVRRDRRLLWR